MNSKTTRLEADVHEMLAERKREDETFSKAIERLVGGRSLAELAGMHTEEEGREIGYPLERKCKREDGARRTAVEWGIVLSHQNTSNRGRAGGCRPHPGAQNSRSRRMRDE